MKFETSMLSSSLLSLEVGFPSDSSVSLIETFCQTCIATGLLSKANPAGLGRVQNSGEASGNFPRRRQEMNKSDRRDEIAVAYRGRECDRYGSILGRAKMHAR